MENHKRRFLTCIEEDRISNLPEHLIVSILEHLPIQDAVRTSILSRKWRYRWTTMMSLVFDQEFSKKIAKNGAFGDNGFIRIINQVVLLTKGPISKFYLKIPRMNLDSFQEVDQWMLFLSKNNVRELIIFNSNRCYEVPSHVFSCSEMRKLTLENCIFKSLPDLERFSNLEELQLQHIDFGTNYCGTLVSLPQLQKLVVVGCINVHNFNIEARKLVNIFFLLQYPNAMLLRLLDRLMDSPSINIFYMWLLKPLNDCIGVERMKLATMFRKLPNIQDFLVHGNFLKFLHADNIPKWFPHAVTSLKHLRLANCQLSDLDQLHGTLCLLRNSPNLERLIMVYPYMKRPWDMIYDVGPASDHLESPDCLDQTLNMLQTVEIIRLDGTRVELLFIKLLLAHSPSLIRMTIQPHVTCDASKRLDIAKDVMRFPRASTKAQIIHLDPKPKP